MLLDIQAAQAVARAKLFERAVNDPGPWAVRIGDRVEWAVKVRTTQSVLFIVHFGTDVTDDVAWLMCRGEEVSSQTIVPSPEGFALQWRVGLQDDKAPAGV